MVADLLKLNYAPDFRGMILTRPPKRARNLYMEEQSQIRRELEEKKAEKHGETLLAEMISGVPRGGTHSMLVLPMMAHPDMLLTF